MFHARSPRIGHAVPGDETGERAYTARAADRVLSDILQDASARNGATRDGLCPNCDDESLPEVPEVPKASNAEDFADDEGHGTVDMSEEEVERSFTRDQIRELALEAIHAQRDALLQARDEGIFSSAALEGALARLDNEEILLVSGQSNSY